MKEFMFVLEGVVKAGLKNGVISILASWLGWNPKDKRPRARRFGGQRRLPMA